VKTNQTGH